MKRLATEDQRCRSDHSLLQPPPPDGSPPRRRKHIYTPILIFLNFLAVLPGLLGFLYSAARFYSTRHLIWTSVWDARSAGGVTEARSTRLDWFISGLWALATAYFTLSLARGLMRRWLVYYSTVPTIIRVVSLQAICWPLALTTHRVLSFDQPVAAWMICATTAAFCVSSPQLFCCLLARLTQKCARLRTSSNHGSRATSSSERTAQTGSGGAFSPSP